MKKLSFGLGNAKLTRNEATFSLPAGWSCPGALACFARAHQLDGHILDGAQQQFRCFAATMEWRASVRDSRWRNFEALRHLDEASMTELLLASLPKAERVRVHVGGDFFNEQYFRAWMAVAAQRPAVTFYAYTKSLQTWVQNIASVPSNFKLTASRGGRADYLIGQYALKYAEVVFSEAQAEKLGLAIDHDDTLAWSQDRPFALLLHSTQQKGSPAAKALRGLRASGHTGYSKTKTTNQ